VVAKLENHNRVWHKGWKNISAARPPQKKVVKTGGKERQTHSEISETNCFSFR